MDAIKKEDFSKSIMYLFFSQGIIKILGLIYSLYLINKPAFGDAGNAIYLSGYQIFVFILTFSSIGVPNAVAHYIAKSDSYNEINKIFKVSVLFYSLVASISCIILFCFSDVIANKILEVECVKYNLKLLSPLVIVVSLESIYIGYFNGLKQMKITANIQFWEQLIKTIFTIVLVEILSKFTNNSEVLSVAATLGVVISICSSFLLCYIQKKKMRVYCKEFGLSKIKYKNIILNLLKFSVPISIGAMLVGINKNCDTFIMMNILAKIIGHDEAHKIYGIIASKVDVLIALPLTFNMTFSTALIPNISEAKKNNDYKSIKKYIESSVYMSLAISIISFLGLFIFTDEIFELLYSNSKDGVYFLKLASISIIFSSITQTFIGVLQGFEKNNISMLAAFFRDDSQNFFKFYFNKSKFNL